MSTTPDATTSFPPGNPPEGLSSTTGKSLEDLSKGKPQSLGTLCRAVHSINPNILQQLKARLSKSTPDDKVEVYWLDEAIKEIERLKRGDFTPQEFQDLCHNMTPTDEASFRKGCDEYITKLFHSPRPGDEGDPTSSG